MPVTSLSANYRFNPHTRVEHPISISGELCTPYYFTEYNDFGFHLDEAPSGVVSVTRSGGVAFTLTTGTPGAGQFAVADNGFIRISSGECSGLFYSTYTGHGRIFRDNPAIWDTLPLIDARITSVSDNLQTALDRVSRSYSCNYYVSGVFRNTAGAIESIDANEWYYNGYGSGFLAVAITGTNRLMFSEDGTNWGKRTATQNNTFTGVAYSPSYSGGLFAICSSDGTRRVQTSKDTWQWTPHNVGTSAVYRDICYGGAFVLVGDTGAILTSTDGQNWTAGTNSNDNQFMAVCYSPTLDRYVAVGNNNTAGYVVITSDDDGQTWTNRTAAGGISYSWDDVAWSEDLQKFAAVSAGDFKIMTSSDGITWTLANAPASSYRKVSAGNGLFVFTTYTGTIYSTADLITFRKHETTESNSWAGIAYGAGRFVAVSFNGSNRTAYSMRVS